MRAYERLIGYAKVWTTSDEISHTNPSAARELTLAYRLADEMKTLGVSDVTVDENGYVYGNIPATKGHEDCPAVGFLAHMDTSPEYSGENVHPVLTENYDGEDLRLGESDKFLRVKDFPHLRSLKGRTLITADGTTLLGADDKAGIAEILTAAEEILKSKRPHGKICLAFTPDEEIGNGAELLDLKRFGADYAYTVDGGAEGDINFENFNAYAADFVVRGNSVHPGDAKDIMVNSQRVAFEIDRMIPKLERPEHTDGYEGFYHLGSTCGDVEETRLHYIVRDFDAENMERRKACLQEIARKLNETYGEGTVTLTLTESYRNMREVIEPKRFLVDYAVEATKKAGVTPLISPIRGGTDGARLSFRGLPCPNLGTGGYGFHGCYEHITVEAMDAVVEILKNLIGSFAERS